MGLSQQIGSSSLSKPGVCTSSTRPATPYEGQMIYETDTDKVLVWNGSAWYANWNLPWGIVGSNLSVAGNFTVNPVMKHLKYAPLDTLPNAERLHEEGFFIGNHHSDVENELKKVFEIFEEFSKGVK